MRALRDFNIPKIITDDMQIFMGLIGDLFPALDVPRKRDFDFEKQVRQAAIDLKLQPEDNFILKVNNFIHFIYCYVYTIINYTLYINTLKPLQKTTSLNQLPSLQLIFDRNIKSVSKSENYEC